MKYLDFPSLQHLSSSLSQNLSSELRVNVRFEAYSTKAIGKERKMYKEMEEAYMSEQEGMEEWVYFNYVTPLACLCVAHLTAQDELLTRDERSRALIVLWEARREGITVRSQSNYRARANSPRKVYFLLVSTLNLAFPDHDFGSLRPDHFTREPSPGPILAELNQTLGPSTGASVP
jgi:hypothetical protein